MERDRSYPDERVYRTAVRYKKKRNTLNMYLMLIVVIASVLVSLLSVNVLFNLRITNLRINGATLYTYEQIQYVGGIEDGQNLIRLNTDYIESRIKNSLVYVDDVTITKNYPDGLTLEITEAVETAQIEYNGSYCTLSESGRLLEINSAGRNDSLMLVTGYELTDPELGGKAESSDDQKADILSEILEKLRELEFEKIIRIDLEDRTDIKLIYDNRIEIALGSSVDLDTKLTYIKAVIDSDLPESYEGTLRYNGIDSGISAIPKEEETDAAYVTSEEDESYDDSGSYNSESYAGDDENSDYYDGYYSSESQTDYTYGYDYTESGNADDVYYTW